MKIILLLASLAVAVRLPHQEVAEMKSRSKTSLDTREIPIDLNDLHVNRQLHGRPTQPPAGYYECRNLIQFLESLGATDLPPGDCCNYEASLGGSIKKITCTKPQPGDAIQNIQRRLTWTNAGLKGDLDNWLSLDETYGVYTAIDLSGNPGIVANGLPIWFQHLNRLESINLADTGLDGTLPGVFNVAFPHLKSTNFSSTNMVGAIPPLPEYLEFCSFNSKMCHYTDRASKCNEGIRACAPPNDKAPIEATPPSLPPLLNNSPNQNPTTNTALQSQQCMVLKEWFISHGYPSSSLWTDARTCCPFWREDFPPQVTNPGLFDTQAEVICLPWGINAIAMNNRKLTGDVNYPSLDSLKALSRVDLRNNMLQGDLSGSWLFNISSLTALSLANNSFSGTVPNVLPLPSLGYFDISGNRLSGTIPQIINRNNASLGSCGVAQAPGQVCWKYDEFYYDLTCIQSNPTVSVCSDSLPPIPTPVEPVVPTLSSAASPTTSIVASQTITNIVSQTTGTIESQTMSATLAPTWTCIQICADKGNFIQITPYAPSTIQCAGPNNTACSWFTDSNCRLLAPGEVGIVEGNGVVCSSVVDGWCKVGYDAVYNSQTQPCSTGSTRSTSGPNQTNSPNLSSGLHLSSRIALIIAITFVFI
jgi:hypothetical protein